MELDNIVNQLFQNEINNLYNKDIRRTEQGEIVRIFGKVPGVRIECNICYSVEMCLECYTCDMKYCKECLIKVASEFQKCSACQSVFINNYDKIEKKNKNLLDKVNINQNINNNKLINDLANYCFDNSFEFNNSQNIQNIQNNRNNRNTGNSIEELQRIIYESIAGNNSSNSGNNSPKQQNNTVKSMNSVNAVNTGNPNNSFLRELRNNERLPYNSSSIFPSNITPNFSSFYDDGNKVQLFISDKANLPIIEINYKLLDINFQANLRLLLIQLVKNKIHFDNKWVEIGRMIKNFNIKNGKYIQDKNNSYFISEKKQLLQQLNLLINS